MEQPGLLRITHGGQGSDDHLGVFEFHQVVQFNAVLRPGLVGPVENALAAGLHFGGVGHLFCVGC